MKKTQHVEKGSGCPGGVGDGGAAGAPRCRGVVVVMAAPGPLGAVASLGGCAPLAEPGSTALPPWKRRGSANPWQHTPPHGNPPHGSWQRCRRHPWATGGARGTPRGRKTHPEHHDVHPRAGDGTVPWGLGTLAVHGGGLGRILPPAAGLRWGQPGDTGGFALRRTRAASSSPGGLGHEATPVSPNSRAPPSPPCAEIPASKQRGGNRRKVPHGGAGGGRGGRGGRGGPASRVSPASPALVNI